MGGKKQGTQESDRGKKKRWSSNCFVVFPEIHVAGLWYCFEIWLHSVPSPNHMRKKWMDRVIKKR